MGSLYLFGVVIYLFIAVMYSARHWKEWQPANRYDLLGARRSFAIWLCTLGAMLWPLSVVVISAIGLGTLGNAKK